jgi:hypothetical protein
MSLKVNENFAVFEKNYTQRYTEIYKKINIYLKLSKLMLLV